MINPRGLDGGTYGPAAPARSIPMLVRVVAPHFVAGIIIQSGQCIQAAPILKWAIGKNRDTLRAYFSKQGWKASIVGIPPANQQN